jgi:transcription-repair coupling factor (superfamily II helicase)
MPLIEALSFLDQSSHSELIPTRSESSEIAATASVHGLLLALQARKNPILVVTTSSRKASELSDELRSYLGSSVVCDYPPWETLPHEKLSPKSDTIAARFHALRLINGLEKSNAPAIVFTSVRALLQPISSDLLQEELLSLEIEKEISLSELIKRLYYFGYSRTDLVERRGDFAVRGGIVDFFPPDRDHPIRVDFFGDVIEDLRFFTVSDQRTFEPVSGEVTVYPCRELLLSEAVKSRAKYIAAEFPQLREMCDKLAEGIPVDGMESLTGLLKPNLKSLLDFLPKEFEIFIIDSPRVTSRAIDLRETNKEFLEASWSNAAMGASAPINISEDLESGGYFSLPEIRHIADSLALNWWSLNLYLSDEDQGIEISTFEPVPIYSGHIERTISDLKKWLAQGFLIIFTASGPGILNRYDGLFRDADIPTRIIPEIHSLLTRDTVYLTTSFIEHGYVSEVNKIVLISEKDISGQRTSNKDLARMPSRRKKAIDPIELKPGDYVVHEQHGVGRYIELVQRTVGSVSREYVVIEYAASKRGQPADRLFVPTDTLEQVTRYVGGEAPAVHRIGGSDWQNAKRRARKAVKQIAAELIQLYAARMSAPGFAFSPDTPWQRELEEAFAYVETTDQLATIEEVKKDMERSHPMDRIVCGDVGYGKTEIAIRAAFKAVQDGKQVAILVPTTLLVQQHLTTFSNRYSGFPITVGGLSRFNSPKQSREVLEKLKNGSLDIVIGTHRLLSKDVEFKDLGLVVVDEEQRFGVEHKEELKKARTNVDVLSMSATPIPRTLEMGITGIREMSNITTPPEERHPVLTYVGPYDEKQVTAAIHRELLRDGQIFFIHNRVESIDGVVERLKKLVPEARIRIAHGQMNERMLEDVILAFWEREFDVLVCTTIIESGIDIPNANTLIVDRADVFGLSQLHQLRGRVGRGRERAYAYFLYPPDKPLTEVAHDRLTTIATNSDLGSGMQVALKDLEIRGAGNLLGGEQSGHIAEVGFDLYMRMVAEAVDEFKTGYIDETPRIKECKVELPVTAHLPTEFVPSERLRLDLYRRMAEASDDAMLLAIREELVDRFGDLPEPAANLMAVAQLRVLAKSFGLTEVVLQGVPGKFLRISPVTFTESGELRLARIYPGSIVKTATSTVLVARPTTANWIAGAEIVDTSALQWAFEVIHSVIAPAKGK